MMKSARMTQRAISDPSLLYQAATWLKLNPATHVTEAAFVFYFCDLGHSDPLVAIEMPIHSIISLALPPVHLFVYSTLLGTELYQSFIMTKVAYQVLPRSAFTTLQKHVFPVYFRSQALLLGVVVLTGPPNGPTSLVNKPASAGALTIAAGTALLNLLIYGPRTQELMVERIHQGMHQSRSRVASAKNTKRLVT